MADDLHELLSLAEQAARIAGDVVMPLFEGDFSVDLKADGTPVTNADRGAEEAMRAFIERECPAHGILGEEFGEKAGSAPYRWVLDPIDGTKSFVHRVPLFGTLIAIERDGEPVVGLIACHAARETISAAKGLGAKLNGRPAHVSSTPTLSDASVMLTSVQGLSRYQPGGYDRLIDAAKFVRTWGDCYGYLLVASGRAEAMLDPIMNHWDVAALYPVITEAGGTITTWQGEAGPGNSAVASNGAVHREILGALGV
jgi:histidinol phosphatase-like enzyme (inositol monophosphatase family)